MPSKNSEWSSIREILDKLDLKAESISTILNASDAELKGKLSQDNLNDLSKIQEGSSLFRNEMKKYLSLQSSEINVSNLTKLRHDLSNLINPIQGYAELLLEEFQQSDANVYDILRKIQMTVHHMYALIEGIKTSPQAENRVLTSSVSKSESPITPFSEGTVLEEDFRHFKEKFAILIVDDNHENCLLLERYLNRIGFTNTQIAHNGYQALALKDRAELILLDIDMPEMSGIDVLRSIKEDIIQGRLMVLMITAADTMENTIECIKLGAEDFLTKPFNPDLLNVRIQSCIEKKWAHVQQNIYREKLKFEKSRYENLLNAVFPSVIVQELAKTGKVQAAYYRNVAVLFADVVSFTHYCDTHEPVEIITNLQEFAGLCERVAIKHKVQKIKTIGDCFLGVSGMLTSSENPVLDCLNFAEELISSMGKLSAPWQLRVGIHFGTVVGGIVGHKQYLFDIWGDTVNTASRIQSQAEPNRVHLSKEAWQHVSGIRKGESLGSQKFKGKEPMEIFSYSGRTA
jgi:class 3 adenylate cyclase/AmiR/NasT family two-component response regulator